MTEQLNKLKEVTGAEEVKVETDENGEAKVEADGEPIAEAKEVDATISDSKDDEDLEKEYSKYEKMFNI